MANGNLPSGFVLDSELPSGFQLDQPELSLPSMGEIEDAFQSIPGVPALSELAAGANRSIAGMVDFFGPDTVNAILEVAGSDKRVPTLTQAVAAPRGSFLEPGLAQEIISTAGEVAPVALGLGQLLRQAAARIPQAVQTTGAGVCLC